MLDPLLCKAAPMRRALAILMGLAAGSPTLCDGQMSEIKPTRAARVTVPFAYVRTQPARKAEVAGLLGLGDEVRVLGCFPDCTSGDAWALLEGGGAVTLSAVALGTEGDPRPKASVFRYGRVRAGGAVLRSAPAPDAKRLGFEPAGHDLAFRVDDALLQRGWLERPNGTFVGASSIRLATPSNLAGEPDPALPLAFVLHDDRAQQLARYDREPVLSNMDGVVSFGQSQLPKRQVRIAYVRPRPSGVPAGAKWVHVDLTEQVLTAYEGDHPVYATLVSTGKSGDDTKPGVYRVWYKMAHGAMHGQPDEPYFVDEVPWVMYFHRSQALHGTFWHDRFGHTISHGCVNLSIADAEWLFRWSPPELPQGWRAILPDAQARASLWVQIEHARPGPLGATPEILSFR
jgi:hypothetical protein